MSKISLFLTSGKTKRILAGLTLAAALGLRQNAAAQNVPLNSDASFAVLAGSGITVAGAVDTTTINGNIGSYPTTTVTGLGNVVLTGVNESANTAVMIAAKNDLTTAFNDAAGAAATTSYATAQDLGGMVLLPGVYSDPTALSITGDLVLNANGNPNAVWIFQAGSTLITSSASEITLIGGAQASDVFWEVGSSATLGSASGFDGNILADTSITDGTGATVDGRLLAENGAVTLDGSDTITATFPSSGNPPPTVADGGSTILLLGLGAAGLLALKRAVSVPVTI